MKKNLIQDVVPPEKKSIRNIPVPDRTLRSRFASSRSNSEQTAPEEEVDDTQDEEELIDATKSTEPAMGDTIIPPTKKVSPVTDISRGLGDDFVVTGHADSYLRRKKMKLFGIGIAVLVVVCASFVILNAFSHVNIVIDQHVETAKLNGSSIKLGYGPNSEVAHIVSSQYPSSIRVAATEEEYVKTKASGKILVYNDFGSSPQKLIKNTRFETSDGKVYRIQDSITVPGKTSSGPGSIEVTVYADSEGESYNIDLVDFTIPGFKGTPQYDGFYARSKTAMAGGFDGVVKKISESDKANAIAQMKADISQNIEKDIKSRLPEGYLYFADLSVIEYGDTTQSDVQKDSVQLNLSATVSTPVFDKTSFAKSLSKQSDKLIPEADSYTVKNPEGLSVKYASEPSLGETGTIDVVVEGDLEFLWTVDEAALKTDLLGKKRSQLNNVFENYKAIESAKASVFPVWVSTLPDNPDDIKIEFTQ